MPASKFIIQQKILLLYSTELILALSEWITEFHPILLQLIFQIITYLEFF
jgi:hypothetical protein